MTDNQKIAYEWAKNQDYQSVAARFAKELVGLVDDLQAALRAQQGSSCKKCNDLFDEDGCEILSKSERKATTGEGLRCKYIVRKADTGDGVDGCFVLRPDRDRAAVAALRAYAAATDDKALSADIINWVGQERNDPLTLDGLRKMDGEPVWIKLFDPDEEFWVLRNEWVDTRNPEPVILFHMRWYSHADYGKTWLAYRQKPI